MDSAFLSLCRKLKYTVTFLYREMVALFCKNVNVHNVKLNFVRICRLCHEMHVHQLEGNRSVLAREPSTRDRCSMIIQT